MKAAVRQPHGLRVQHLETLARREDLEQIAALWADGHVTPIVDRSYSLVEAAAVLQRVGDKLGLGNLLIVP